MNSGQSSKTKTLDQDQLAVRNADLNVVVSAGAGSGKTTVLAERYVRLVCERGIPVDKILTLTFTRKAAAEMYSRIYQRLSESNHVKAKEQLKQFDQARISTLDSFCTLICRGASYRYGIAGNFKMDETELAHIAEDTAINIIMKYRDEKVIHNLVSSRSFDHVSKYIFADIGIRFINIVDKNDFEKLAEKQIIFLDLEMNSLWKSIEELCEKILSIHDDKQNANLIKAKDAVKKFPKFQSVNDEVLKTLSSVSLFLSSGDSFKKPPSNVKDSALIELRMYAEPLKEQTAKLENVLESYSFKDDILQIGKIFNDYAKCFQDAKRREGILSFADTAELAVAILRDDHELRNYYKHQFKAIMIDEFQDNNHLQKELLYLLAECEDTCSQGIPFAEDLASDKLFFVGDEKQSIYRFRGADVSVFRGLSAELEKAVKPEARKHPVSMALQTNYRSHPELVIFFNMFFSEVFGQTEKLYEAEYKTMIAGQSKKSENKPRIEVYLQELLSANNEAAEDENIDAASSEAVHVAARIIEGVKNGEFSFNDIAILFRSTTHQNSYERCFRNCGIPFSAADPRAVFVEAVVNDFYAILRLALFHQDSNAYGTVLRSPFVRIGDETFVRIMLESRDVSSLDISLLNILSPESFSPNEPFPENPPLHWFQNESDRARYVQGQLIFNQLKEKIDIEEISEVLSFLWYETPYRIDLLNNPDTFPLLDHFDYLYDMALDADRRKLNMASFLDELAPLVGTYSKTESGDPEIEKTGVTLMTVHKSKGLEFKVVIIADAGSAGRTKTGAYFFTDEFGPVINMKSIYAGRDKSALNYIYEIGKEENRFKAEAELKRLFYVAATRAEERLMIFGSRKINNELEEALDALEGKERLNALLSIPRESGSRKTECKDSFMDLLYIAANKMKQRNIKSNWFAKSIPLLCMNEEKRKISELRSVVKSLQSNNMSYQNLMPLFYSLPSREMAVPVKRMISPSALEVFYFSDTQENFLPSFSCDRFLVNENLKKAFGTLCHSVIEKLFKNENPENIPYDVMDVFRKENLKQGEIKIIQSTAHERGKIFLASDLGKQALLANRCETEYPFYLPFRKEGREAIMVKGTIDLIFENNYECIIIDFKTDQYMKPEIHQVQMDTYRLAAKAFSDFPVRIFLVYLRSMEIVLVDPVLTEENLFDAMEEMFKKQEIE